MIFAFLVEVRGFEPDTSLKITKKPYKKTIVKSYQFVLFRCQKHCPIYCPFISKNPPDFGGFSRILKYMRVVSFSFREISRAGV